MKTSLAIATQQLTLTANASGNVGFYIFPVNVTGSASGALSQQASFAI